VYKMVCDEYLKEGFIVSNITIEASKNGTIINNIKCFKINLTKSIIVIF